MLAFLSIVMLQSTVSYAQEAPPIVGGYTTSDFEQVGQVFAYNESSGYSAAFCSGTLIHPSWVVTAAHCVAGSDAAQGMANQGYTIYFVIATDVYAELQNGRYTAIAAVSSMEAHSGYNPNDSNSIRDDIALLRLQTPIYEVSPMPLNRQAPNTSWNDIRYVGFGITGTNRQDSALRRTVEVPLNDSNNQYWPYTTDSMFMYTWDPAGRTNICSGDSGGAALRQHSDGTYSLAGVNSFGMNVQGGSDSCSGVGAVAGSTRIDMYYSWLSARVDFSQTSEPSVEPSTEPSSPSSEPTAEPGTDSTTGDWVAPFPDGEYDDSADLKVSACSSANTSLSSSSQAWWMFAVSFVSIVLTQYRTRRK